MRQKTFFCNNCAEKIEETDKSWKDGGRYCSVCRHDFPVQAYGSKFLMFLAVLVGLFGIGSLWRGGEKTLNVSAKQIAVNSVNQGKVTNQTPPANSNSSVPPLTQKNNALQNTVNSAGQAPTKQTESAPVSSVETVYYCGAMTKKGTSCTRRVRGGGRCWQHKGQAAILPPEKLPASQ